MRASEKKANKQLKNPNSESTYLDEDLIRKKGAANHELADADADDQMIKSQIGEGEIDQDSNSESEKGIPYSRNFLRQKKTKRMEFWINYFAKKQKERFQRFINNGEEYRHHIEKIFISQGLPKELYYVGLIESGYYLGARSHAAAVGPWQFIRGTGSRYGLKINREVDERQDLFKSSLAAAKYFKDLHNVFSSWELALSAYNAGEYGIIRRIMKYGTRDFYELSKNKQLPSETINYVPKVLAAMHIIENAKEYGFHLPKRKHKLFDRTELKRVTRNTSLKVISKNLKIDLPLLRKLNPELKRDFTPRFISGHYPLRVPKKSFRYEDPKDSGTTPSLANTAKVESDELEIKTTPSIHTVKNGETIFSLSRKYNISVREIARFNQFPSWKQKLKVGQKVFLSKNNNLSFTRKVSPIVYKVRKGDNLSQLAKIFDLEVSKLRSVNKIGRRSIVVGQKIILPGTKKYVHTVKKGEHLSMIARKSNLSLEGIIKLNNLRQKTLYPGQKIIVNRDSL